MIFVTVGTQLPFDRLVRAVDEWAGSRGRRDVIAQVGPGSYAAKNIEARPFMSPQECAEHMRKADAIVAHAGMGSIIGALELGKPILIMPRRAALGEHRNDHQLATVRRFAEREGVLVAMNEDELPDRLDALQAVGGAGKLSPYATAPLLEAVRAFIENRPLPSAAGRTLEEAPA